MLTRSLIAAAVGFVVGTPVAFWLLKKVRIKSKVRHVQVSLALSLPIALFIFILQTSFALPVVVITVAVLLLVVGIELIVRRIVASGGSSSSRTFAMHRIGASVPLDEGRSASGSYPDDYFTEEFKTEMHLFSARFRERINSFISLNGPIPQRSYRGCQGANFYGKHNSSINGIRGTTDTPFALTGNQKVYVFGGSTVFCTEVPDRLTISSFLQRLVKPLSKSIQVFNNGFSGATAVDRHRMLTEVVEIERGDLVVFYFGDNDSGWIDHRSGKLSQQLLPLPIKALRGLADFGSEAARWFYGELAPIGFRKFSQLAVNDTIEALDDAHEYCVSKGARMIAILQPNLHTLRMKSKYEKILELRFSRDLKTLINDAYQQYEEWVEETPYAASATHIFNNAAASVFLDWSHVNARGNEIIAKFIFEELNKRKLFNVSSEVCSDSEIF